MKKNGLSIRNFAPRFDARRMIPWNIVVLLFVFSKALGQTTHPNANKFCHSIDFVQDVKLTNPKCDGHKMSIHNKRCAGICGLRFIPNPVDPRLTPSDLCVMCRPEISEIELSVTCKDEQEAVKLLIVRDCKCKSVDCTCGLRRPKFF